MKGFKRIIATILLCITLFLSVFNSYSMTMTVQAAELTTVPFIQSVLSLFGASSGLGNQSDFWYRASYFENVVNAVKNGLVYKFSDYGDVDFSDSDSVNKWLKWARGFENFIKTSASVGGGSTYTAAMVTMAKALDAVSYKVSGSSATASISDNIQTVIDEAETGSIVDDVKETFKTISDDVADSEIDWRKMSLAFGVIGSSLISDASLCGKFQQALISPSETVYDEYANSFAAVDGFIPGASLPACPGDSSAYVGKFCVVAESIWGGQIVYYLVSNSSANDNLFAYWQNDDLILSQYVSSSEKVFTVSCQRIWYEYEKWVRYGSNSGSISRSELITCFIPIFSNQSDGVNYFKTGDYSECLNLADVSSYPTFKAKTKSLTDDIAPPLRKYLDTHPAIGGVKALADALAADLPDIAGTKDYAPAISKAITDTVADAGTDVDTPSSSANYFGILGKILAAILALTTGIWELFCSPVTAIVDGVNMISDFVKALVDTSDSFIKELVDYLEAILAGILALDMTVQFPFGSPEDDSSGDSSGSSSGTAFLNGFLILIYIIFMLLRIFLHLLEFIINIFKIPAAPGFITGDFATGFNYIKSVQLSPLNISVYDFLMGLIHILLIFSVVKTLKHHIDKIHI